MTSPLTGIGAALAVTILTLGAMCAAFYSGVPGIVFALPATGSGVALTWVHWGTEDAGPWLCFAVSCGLWTALAGAGLALGAF